jgi:hypothetical protein
MSKNKTTKDLIITLRKYKEKVEDFDIPEQKVKKDKISELIEMLHDIEYISEDEKNLIIRELNF